MTHDIRSVETPARYDRLERFADQLRDWGCQRFPEERVLIEIEVDAIDATGRRNCLGIEARTVQRSADLAVRLCKPYAFLRGARELRSDCAFRVDDRRGSHDQDRRHRHTGFYRRLPSGSYERCNAQRGMPRGVRMHGLEVVCAQRQDDERERRMHLDFLSESEEPVASRQERIFENCSTAVQAVFQNACLIPAL